MILDVANPSIIDDGDKINIVIIIIGVIVLLCLIGIIIYLMKRGKKNEKN